MAADIYFSKVNSLIYSRPDVKSCTERQAVKILTREFQFRAI